MKVRIPADIEMEDRIVAGLTFRQLAILGLTAIAACGAYLVLEKRLPPIPAVAMTALFGAPGVVIAWAKPEGVHLERLLGAAARWWRHPRLRVLAPEGVIALSSKQRAPQVGEFVLPVSSIVDDGIVSLEGQGAVLLSRATSLNFDLRSEEEKERLIGGLGLLLNSLDSPIQFLIRSEKADLRSDVAALREKAGALPEELRTANASYAQFLLELAQRNDTLSRAVFVCFRESSGTDVAMRLKRRFQEASSMLAPLGIRLTCLDGHAASDLIGRASDRESLRPETMALPGAVIRRDGGESLGSQSDESTSPIIGPDSLEVLPRRVKVGGGWCETFAVTGYPREVGPAWLAPLLSFSGCLDISIHVEPVPNGAASGQMSRQLARLESTRRIESDQGRLSDPGLDAAASDAAELLGSIARGEARLFRVGLYLTVRAGSEDALRDEVEKVRALCSALLMETRPVTFRSLEGWLTTLPLATDQLRLRRSFDTNALASCFPFASCEVSSDGGVLVGANALTGGLVYCDRFAHENYNQVVLARSGAGKSYYTKLEVLRHLCRGLEVLVIDPEDEYRRLAEAVGGRVICVSREGFANPLRLTRPGEAGAASEQMLFAHAVVQSVLGELSSGEKSVLDKALVDSYRANGISDEPKTHAAEPPNLSKVVERIRRLGATDLASKLEPYSSGSHRRLLESHSSISFRHLTVFSLRDLPDSLKGPAVLLALDAIWRRVTQGERRPRLVVVDEAWWLLGQGKVGAGFLHRLAKSARKNWCGLTTVTQDVSDVLSTELGQAVITNSSTQVLLGQSPQAIEGLARAFDLSAGERSYLMSCERGQGLLCLGRERAAVKIIASSFEEPLITTSPEFLATLENPESNTGIEPVEFAKHSTGMAAPIDLDEVAL